MADYLWVAEDGLKMQGYNGSQLWDTGFTVQAYAATGILSDAVGATLKRAHTYVKNTQVMPNNLLLSVYSIRTVSPSGASISLFLGVQCPSFHAND